MKNRRKVREVERDEEEKSFEENRDREVDREKKKNEKEEKKGDGQIKSWTVFKKGEWRDEKEYRICK